MLARDAQPVEPNETNEQQIRSRMISFVRACFTRARRVREQILALERKLDDLLIEADALEEGASVLLLLTRGAPPGAGVEQGPDTTGPLGSQPVAHSLILNRRPDKFFDVRIDFAKEPFAIQQQLGLFLNFIADGEPSGPSGIVHYRTEEELFGYLKIINCRTKNPRKYVGKLVNALKDALEAAGYSRDYVQRNSQGVRFRRLKPAGTLPGRRGPVSVDLA